MKFEKNQLSIEPNLAKIVWLNLIELNWSNQPNQTN